LVLADWVRVNGWRIFNIISVIAGMVAAGMWLGFILAWLEAPGWAVFLSGVLLGRVTLKVIRNMTT